jgi:dTDP-4-amino-4,6-dideoxygalactose transaminase
MRRLPFVDLAAQRAALTPALQAACMRAIERGDHVLGADVEAFEREWAEWCGVRHAVGVDSGTSAIELALRACGVGPGDEVVTVANTFVATAFAITHVGATPVLVDAQPDTWTIDVGKIAAALTPRTRAIVPVHLYGGLCDMAPLLALAREHGLAVVEDACQAHGATERGRRAGAFGDAAAFSFYPAKNLGALGDGGMVVTSDDTIADRCHVLRNYGQRVKYHSDELGFNRRLDTLQAAMLRIKLPHLDGWNAARRRHAEAYDAALEGLPLVRPRLRDGVEGVWHLYAIRVRERDRVREALGAEGIETGIHYPVPVHLQGAYAGGPWRAGDFPVSERLSEETLSLPMYPELPARAADRVASALRRCLQGVAPPGPLDPAPLVA